MQHRTTVYLSRENREWLTHQPRTLKLSQIVNRIIDELRANSQTEVETTDADTD